jgi:hypothetical protein
VTGTQFFLYNSIQQDIQFDQIGGKPDVVSLLYTDEGVDQYVTYPNHNTNGYGVLSNINSDFGGFTDTIKAIVPTSIM